MYLPNHYTPHHSPLITLSREFLTDLLKTTAAVTEAINGDRGLLAIFNDLGQKGHLPDGHGTVLGICSQIALELTWAAYLIPDREYPGVFDYEVPPKFLDAYRNEAFALLSKGTLPSPEFIRSTAKKVVTEWFTMEPDWEVTVEGSPHPLHKTAKDLPSLVNLLVSAGVDLTKVSGIRQVPDGVD